MLFYNTGVPVTPPIRSADRSDAIRGILRGGSGDVYAGRAAENAVDYDRDAQMANAEFVAKARDLQSQMALRGAQQMDQARQNQADLATRRMNMAVDQVGPLLGGVNSILRSLYQ